MDRIYYPKARVTLSLVPFDSSAGEELITIGDVMPTSLEYTSAPLKEADTFTVKVPLRFFASDPRLFRAVAVAGWMGDAGALGAALDTSADALMVLGHADDSESDLSNKDEPMVSFRGRSYKGLLLDEKWQGRKVQLGRKLSVIVREVLDSIPATAPLIVELEADGFDPVVPAARRGRAGQWFRASTNTDVFSALLQMSVSAGAIVQVRGDRVIVGKPRTLDETATAVPYFVTGENLTSLKIKRKFGTRDLPNIRVTATDPVTLETVTGQYPVKTRATKRAVRVKSQTKPADQKTIHSIALSIRDPTKAMLDAIAKRVFERYAQHQVSVSFETKDMALRRFLPGRYQQGEDGEVMPATAISNGSPVRILIQQDARDVLLKALTPEQKRRELVARGFNERVAAVLARGWEDIDTTMFVDRVTHSYDATSGYRLSGQASAYLTITDEDLE